MTAIIRSGDCREILPTLADESADCVVTSPPYFRQRNYGVTGQIGLEPTPDEYVDTIVSVFRLVRRVLRNDGTIWLNLGDSYARGFGGGSPGKKSATNAGSYTDRTPGRVPPGFNKKDLLMIPSRTAIALQSDGWILRSQIIWNKPNAMTESVKDRPANAHESIFLFSKSEKYFYDHHATLVNGNNLRNVWSVPTRPNSEDHFAQFPPALIEPCIKAGCRVGGMVLDPFAGAGTTAVVAESLARNSVLIELNPDYTLIAERRIGSDAPLFQVPA